MAKVPGINRVQASQLGVQRTTLPRVNAPVDFGVSARALVDTGRVLGAAAADLSAFGREQQLKDEDREAQDLATQARRMSHDAQFGNPDQGITGYREVKAQSALDAADAQRVDLRKRVSKLGEGIASQRVKDHFKTRSDALLLEFDNGHASYLVRETRTAEDASDAAALTALTDDVVSNPFDPNNASRIGQIIALSLNMADRQGITDEQARADIVQSNLTATHSLAVKNLLDTGRASEAAVYYARNKSQIVPRARGDLEKSIMREGVREEAQGEFDAIVAIPFSTDADRLAAARQIQDGAVRDSVVARIRAHNADLARQEREADKNLRVNAIGRINAGSEINTLTPEEFEAVSQTPGMLEQLRRIAQFKASGRPHVSDRGVRAQVFDMQTEDPAKFVELDLNRPPYVSGLDVPDRNMFQSLQIGMRNAKAREEASDRKEVNKGARLSRAITATKDMLKSFSLNAEEEANIKTALSLEIEKLSSEGEKLTDNNYRNIVRGLYLESAEFFGANERLFETLAKRGRPDDPESPFEIENVVDTDEYEEVINIIAADTGIASQDVDLITRQILSAGRVPTPLFVRRQYDLAISRRGK